VRLDRDALVDLDRDTLQCLSFGFRRHRNTRNFDDCHSVDNIHSCNDLDCNRRWLFSTGIFKARQDPEAAKTHRGPPGPSGDPAAPRRFSPRKSETRSERSTIFLKSRWRGSLLISSQHRDPK
jgi:hypothetical protein